MRIGKTSFNQAWLKSCSWTEFKSIYAGSSLIGAKNDLELYEAFKFLTGKKVAGMERKLNK